MHLFENKSNLLNMPKCKANFFFQNYSSEKKKYFTLNPLLKIPHIIGHFLDFYILNKLLFGKDK